MKRLLLSLLLGAASLPSAAAPLEELIKCPMNRWKIEIPGTTDLDGQSATPLLSFQGETAEAVKERVFRELLRIPGLEIDCDRGRGAITISN